MPRIPESDGDLASQPTLSRFENRVTTKDLRRLSDRLLDLYLKTHPGPRKVIILDMDATDDPTHGKQQLSFLSCNLISKTLFPGTIASPCGLPHIYGDFIMNLAWKRTRQKWQVTCHYTPLSSNSGKLTISSE